MTLAKIFLWLAFIGIDVALIILLVCVYFVWRLMIEE